MKRLVLLQNLLAYLFMAPALVLMGLFTFYPVLYGAYLGFTDYTAANLGSGEPPRWVGFDNLRYVLSDPLFQRGLFNSLQYLVVVPVLQLASLAVAVLVNQKLPLMTFFRVGYYIPVVTSISLAAVMWEWIFQKDGLLNWSLQLLQFLNFDNRFNWLLNEYTALWAIMLVTFWRGFGYYMVLYLAGLQAIPAELEEAATLDGANPWQRFWYVVVPLMRPTLLLCSLLSTIAALRVLDEILVFTGGTGGPLNSTYTALLYVYNKSFGLDFDYGKASAAGLIIALVGFALSYINFRVTREERGV
jgi:putative chitobiose transport system permease protein